MAVRQPTRDTPRRVYSRARDLAVIYAGRRYGGVTKPLRILVGMRRIAPSPHGMVSA